MRYKILIMGHNNKGCGSLYFIKSMLNSWLYIIPFNKEFTSFTDYNRTIFFLSTNKEFGKPHVLRSSLRSDIFFDGQIKAGKKEKW